MHSPEPSAIPAAPPSHRLHALDNLRAVVMLTVITQHAALAYVSFANSWPMADTSRSFGFTLMVGIIGGFRSHLFFLLAGFFSCFLWQRSGLQGFIRQRARRIGLPFLLGMLTLVPLSSWISLWATQQLPLADGAWPILFMRPGHLWFLEILLLHCAAASLILWVGSRTPHTRSLRALDAGFDWLLARPARILLLVPLSMLLMWAHHDVGLVHDKGADLTPPLRAILYYGSFFLLGWWLHRRAHHLPDLARSYKSHLLIALLSFPVFGIGHMVWTTPGQAHPLWLKALIIAASALYAWAGALAVTGWFLRHAGGHSPRVRYLADASYWVYLAHYPLVLWLQKIMLPWGMNCWLKFTLNVIITLAVLLILYDRAVRHTWLGRLLHGPRTRPA
ncbi:MAG: acyltransferase family protein [Prosthecobacter sp.]